MSSPPAYTQINWINRINEGWINEFILKQKMGFPTKTRAFHTKWNDFLPVGLNSSGKENGDVLCPLCGVHVLSPPRVLESPQRGAC